MTDDRGAETGAGNPSIADQLHHSRRHLLDLTLRNTLINFKRSRSRGVQVVDELPREAFRLLVREKRALSFQPAADGESDAAHAATEDTAAMPNALLTLMAETPDDDEPAKRHRDTRLQTPCDQAALNLRLRNTWRAARLSIEERGVNILFLALGQLQWCEKGAQDTPRRAPLILIPAALERSDARGRFTLRWTEEELAANLSLAEKIRQDFGVRLPDLPDPDDLDVNAWFGQVQAATAEMDGWTVDAGAIDLGFFSFNKLLLWKDLDPAVWPDDDPPDRHPLLQALLGGDNFREAASTIADDDHLDDRLDAAELHQVVDADSSQTIALVDVRDGRNLVIQGPPGTGKSQTITNLIAEAIAGGRTVLFVAEKMAALDVVKRRLDAVQIGDACLELHSHKANKRTMLDELKRTLGLGKPQLADPAEDRKMLAANRERLNAYARAVNTPIGAASLSPHDVIGRLTQVEEESPATWPAAIAFDDAHTWTDADANARRETVEELRILIDRIGTLDDHPFRDSGRLEYLPTDRPAVVNALNQTAATLRTMETTAAAVGALLPGNRPTPDRAAVARIVRTARLAAGAPDLTGVDCRHPHWTVHSDQLRALARDAAALADLHARYDDILRPEAWDAVVLPWRQPVRTWSTRWWRFMSGAWRAAQAGLRALCRDDLPAGPGAPLAIVDAILDAQRLLMRLDDAHGLHGSLLPNRPVDPSPAGRRTWAAVVTWMVDLQAGIAGGDVDDRIHDLLDAGPTPAALMERADTCDEAADRFAEALAQVDAELKLRPDPVPDGARLGDRPFADIADWLQHAVDKIDTLDDIVRFNRFTRRVDDLARRFDTFGLEAIAAAAREWPEACAHLTHHFDRSYLSSLIKQAFADHPELEGFDGKNHQRLIDQFRKLDLDLFQHNRALVAEAHWNRLPRAGGGGQVGLLRREFEKKRRHLAIRTLMDRAGQAILRIKPVFMMSPLSIAAYVPPGSIRFDLVIFDEASQVRPVEAISALLRARQAVVVGDDRQLPPTSFFDRLADDDSDDDDDDNANANAAGDLESLLGMFSAASAPERMLRWHYRSRHPSLIAVSNHEFYDNRLVLFPSPDKDRIETGLHFHHNPDTLYERGARKRINVGEAQVVAQEVMNHARTQSDLTLGVAAFSIGQARRIEDEIEILRREDPTSETFFGAHAREPFFVKNLENVQGDERDVMLISIGYGKIAGGALPMNFGPLNNDGGERRLNVLITRARRRLHVYANFTDEDLDLSRSGARGVAALKTFLHYARTGNLDVPEATGRETGSPFETAVAAALRARGHNVHHQVGSAGFFIDLAVVDPARPGRYLLGIECDGATYHSARSARDRDRLRQQVLEGHDWTIHRIWSTDWFRQPQRQIEHVEAAIRQARTAATGGTGPEGSRAGGGGQAGTGAEGCSPAPLGRDTSPPPPATAAESAIPYTVALLDGADGDTIARLVRVVEVESPIHVQEAARRLAQADGRRATKSVIRAVASIARRAEAEGRIVSRGAFLWRSGQTTPDVRRRDASDLPPGVRTIGLIAPEEVATALRRAVSRSHGITPDELVTNAVRQFGFARTGRQSQAQVQAVLDRLVADGVLQVRSGMVHDPDLL